MRRLLLALIVMLSAPLAAQAFPGDRPPSWWHPKPGGVNCIQVIDSDGNFNCSSAATVDPLTGAAVFAGISGFTVSPIVPEYATFSTLPSPSTAGTLARVNDEDHALYVYDGAAWRSSGEFAGRKLHVPGPPIPLTTTSAGLVGIGTISAAVGLHMDATLYSTGSVVGMQLTPVLYPSSNYDPAALVSGDPTGLWVAPTVHINPNSKGSTPANNDTHKWVRTATFIMPEIPVSTGKPQDIVGLWIGPSESAGAAVVDQTTASQGVSGFYVSGGLANKINGSLLFTTNGAPAIQNIRSGADDWFASAIYIKTILAPSSDNTKNPGRDAWAINSGVSINTDTSGTHDDMGNAYFRTPVITNNGATSMPFISVVKIGDAPTTGGVATTNYRALAVGTGRTQIAGFLAMGDSPTSAGAGDILLDNNTGEIRFENGARNNTLVALRTDTSNRLLLGEGYTELRMSSNFMVFTEVTAPSVASANQARVYAKDNGAGKTQLCAIFSAGAEQCFATQP